MCYTIEEIKTKTIPIAKKHGISRMCLFGSYARCEANDNSDIDIYVDKGKMTSLIKYMAFVYDLEIVWNSLIEDIPELKEQILKLS